MEWERLIFAIVVTQRTSWYWFVIQGREVELYTISNNSIALKFEYNFFFYVIYNEIHLVSSYLYVWIYKRFKKEQLNIYLDCFCKWKMNIICCYFKTGSS